MTDKSPTPFDPSTWIEAQRRSLEAFTNAGQIMAESMRSVAERQAAMVQGAMHDLWGEMQQFGGLATGRTPEPADQLARLRAPFEKVLAQVQEMSGLLMQAQGRALEVLNRCAAANMEEFGKLAPELAAMQKAATDAIQGATSQVTAAVEEMRRRMATLEAETRDAVSGGGGTKKPR